MTRFALDKRNARIMGVCAGIAGSTGADLLLVRLATVLLTVVLLGPVGIAAYLVAGFCAPERAV
ncbi:MAG TPA: PspC domain-containing protein [Sphingomonas sp.]|uniref:PspC domain-containing protein n=1 Tax=Sphingomonas sp. TaxID=28214 RepID=UPI002ED867E3